MNDEYGYTFLSNRAGQYVSDFLKPYMERFDLRVDVNRSSYKEMPIIDKEGGYAGKITLGNGAAKFTIYLNNEGTLILSGEASHKHISGVVEKMNDHDKVSMTHLILLQQTFLVTI